MITLVNPPNPRQTVSNKDMMGGLGQLYPVGARQRIPPLDVPYAAAVLRARGIAVRVIDCLAADLDLGGLLVGLLDRKPQYVAIRTSTPTFEWDMQVARAIKQVTGSTIIVFGSHVTLFPRPTFDHDAVDAVVVGEAETALPEIVERGQFAGCQGVWYRDDARVIPTSARPPIEDLDRLPFPAWDLLPYREYEGTELMRNLRPFVTAQTSRGCPYACAYCPYPVAQGRKLRVRSAASVVDELTWLVERLGVKAVLFRDPEFALQRERVIGICQGLLRDNVQVAWRCETRLEDLDKELIALMGRAGCIGINMGIESADPQVLKGMNRKAVPFEAARRIVGACHRSGIDTFCFFILGLPGETRQSALETIDYAVRLRATRAQFTVATPYPGTALREWAESHGHIEDSALRAMTGYNAAMRNEHLTVEEIRYLQRYAREALSMRPGDVAKRVLGGARQAASEIKRCLDFHAERLAQRNLRKAAAAKSAAG